MNISDIIDSPPYWPLLREMPEMTGFNTDFEDLTINKTELAHVMSLQQIKKVSVKNGYTLYNAHNPDENDHFYVATDNITHHMIYYCLYREVGMPQELSPAVTQTILWRYIRKSRDKYSGTMISPNTRTSGLPEEVIFDFLLKNYTSLVCDARQSKAGRDFWKKLMAIAASRDFNVYYANLDTDSNFDKFDPSNENIQQWIESKNAWNVGTQNIGSDHTMRRFVISTK